MKKFIDAKNPLSILKAKLQIKSASKEEYGVFYQELLQITKEQQKFLDALEYKIAVADCMDPVQVICLNVPFDLYHPCVCVKPCRRYMLLACAHACKWGTHFAQA